MVVRVRAVRTELPEDGKLVFFGASLHVVVSSFLTVVSIVYCIPCWVDNKSRICVESISCNFDPNGLFHSSLVPVGLKFFDGAVLPLKVFHDVDGNAFLLFNVATVRLCSEFLIDKHLLVSPMHSLHGMLYVNASSRNGRVFTLPKLYYCCKIAMYYTTEATFL